jgi:selenium-binding protein 1
LFGRKILIAGILVILVGMGATLVVSTAVADESYEPNNGKSSGKGFTYGFKIMLDGEYYYLAGPPISQASSVRDVPGHYWVKAGNNRIIGKHFNTGPFGASSWWSSDAGDGAYLFKVDGIIDTWSMMKAQAYANKGYVHYHEFISVDDGEEHPTKVLWLKHTAVSSFTFDGGPMAPMSDHMVKPGVDYNFMPNYMMPYSP